MNASPYSTDTSQVSSVRSTYGHRFMSDGGDNTESCLTCGYMVELMALADDPTRGEYVVYSGDVQSCSHDTSRVHGIERHCHEHDEPCEHTEHDCNCIACA